MILVIAILILVLIMISLSVLGFIKILKAFSEIFYY